MATRSFRQTCALFIFVSTIVFFTSLSSCRSVIDTEEGGTRTSDTPYPASDLPILLAGKDLVQATGVMDANGDSILPPIFRNVSRLPSGGDNWPIPVQHISAPTHHSGWGYVDQSGEWLVGPDYKQVQPFFNGIGRIYDGHIWYAVDSRGQFLSDVRADELGIASEGLIPARLGDSWGVFSETGETVVPFEYDYVGTYRYGIAAAARDGRWGYIDNKNNVVVPFEYGGTGKPLGPDRLVVLSGASRTIEREIRDWLPSESTRVYQVIIPSEISSMRYDVVDRSGNTIWSADDLRDYFPELSGADLLSINLNSITKATPNAVLVQAIREYGELYPPVAVVNLNGVPIFDELYRRVHFSDDGGYAVSRELPVTITRFDQDFGVKNTVEIQGFPPENAESAVVDVADWGPSRVFDNAIELGFSATDGRYGREIYETATGRVLESPETPFDENTGDEYSFVGAIDTVPSLFRYVSPYAEFWIKVELTGRFGGESRDIRVRYDRTAPRLPSGGYPAFIENRRTKEIIRLPESVQYVRGFHDGIAAFSEGDKWGFLRETGDHLVPPRFTEASDMINGTAAAKQDGSWGIIDRTGRWIISPVYQYAMPFMGELAPVWNGEKWGYLDRSGQLKIDFIFEYAEPFRDGWAVVAEGVESIRWHGTRGVGHPSFIVSGDSYVIRDDGTRLLGISGDTIWRLYADEILIRDGSRYFLHRLSDGRRAEIDPDKVDNYRANVMYSPQRLFR